MNGTKIPQTQAVDLHDRQLDDLAAKDLLQHTIRCVKHTLRYFRFHHLQTERLSEYDSAFASDLTLLSTVRIPCLPTPDSSPTALYEESPGSSSHTKQTPSRNSVLTESPAESPEQNLPSSFSYKRKRDESNGVEHERGNGNRSIKARQKLDAARADLCTSHVLTETRDNLRAARRKRSCNQNLTISWNSGTDEIAQDIVSRIESVKALCGHACEKVEFATARARYFDVLITDIYDQYKEQIPHGKIAVRPIFARAVLEDSWTKDKSDGQLAGKWRIKLQENRVWSELAKAFGCGILVILRLTDDSARNLKRDDLSAFILEMHRSFPALKDDLKELSYVFHNLVHQGVLPEAPLRIEDLEDEDLSGRNYSDLKELFSCDSLPVSGPAVHYRSDQVSTEGAPAVMASETRGDCAVVADTSDGAFDEVSQERFEDGLDNNRHTDNGFLDADNPDLDCLQLQQPVWCASDGIDPAVLHQPPLK